ncbi:hypothetical protein RD792_005274 [Penstemon davidsonii]|uniref:Pentatricopeptide repeat-containing protein n=1 Tax=Penstemon davidsonii TaxID=160366 RepID=A0ABR0DJR3_9LAMI|nr:hypothetical protein RD792_005274 [Penstemon davidsonii]
MLCSVPNVSAQSHFAFNQIDRPTLPIWNYMIRGRVQSESFIHALYMFDEMRERGLRGDNLTFIFLGLSRKVFDEMGMKDLVSWNSLICGYSQCAFDAMRAENVKADAVTMVKVVLACRYLGQWNLRILWMTEMNVVSWNAMIAGDAKSGDLVAAKKLFDEMPTRDVISWTCMITGYAQANQ